MRGQFSSHNCMGEAGKFPPGLESWEGGCQDPLPEEETDFLRLLSGSTLKYRGSWRIKSASSYSLYYSGGRSSCSIKPQTQAKSLAAISRDLQVTFWLVEFSFFLSHLH
ncbi:hypothetical protein I7I48_00690 [Histoplasma ohiense]|nr:hypothetical protein I7I48_00690 [Histoplasma ohiense (nom. inval.)]